METEGIVCGFKVEGHGSAAIFTAWLVWLLPGSMAITDGRDGHA